MRPGRAVRTGPHRSLTFSFYDYKGIDGNRAVRAQDQRVHVDRGYPRVVDGETAESDERDREGLSRGGARFEPGCLRDKLPSVLLAEGGKGDRGERECLNRTTSEADREDGAEVGVAR